MWSRPVGVIGLLCVASCVIARVAHAQSWEDPEGDVAPSVPTAPPVPAQPVAARTQWARVTQTRAWYGNQILISDALTVSLTSVGLGLANANKDPHGQVVSLGFGSYVLAAPIVHGVHERWGIATASFSLRFFTPLAGALVGASYGTCPHNDQSDGVLCGNTTAIEAGFLGGIVIASALDAALFSYENRTSEPATTGTLSIAPAISADGKCGELRAFGTF